MPFSGGKPAFIYHQLQSIDKSVDLTGVEMQRSRISEPLLSKYIDRGRPHPAMIVKSTLPRVSSDRSTHSVTNDDQWSEIENLPIPEEDLVSVVSINVKL